MRLLKSYGPQGFKFYANGVKIPQHMYEYYLKRARKKGRALLRKVGDTSYFYMYITL